MNERPYYVVIEYAYEQRAGIVFGSYARKEVQEKVRLLRHNARLCGSRFHYALIECADDRHAKLSQALRTYDYIQPVIIR